MLQLIALLLCAIVLVISTVPLQIALVSESAKRTSAVLSGTLILIGGLAIAAVGAYLSFAIIPDAVAP